MRGKENIYANGSSLDPNYAIDGDDQTFQP